jgi:tRNA(fMet)-specific endonuclease VapC
LAYLLDTNIVIHARDGHEGVLAQLLDHRGALLMSALTLAELQRGLAPHHPQAALRRARFDVLLPYLPVLAFDHCAAEAYGRIIASLGWVRGRDFDRLIAAQALAAGAVLVTDNTADFRNIPGLALENWLAAGGE